MSFTTVLLGLLVFNVLIIAHEVGHLLAARTARLEVMEFSIGIGPRLFSFTIGHTEYVWRLLPLGGYVLVPDLAPPEEGEWPVSIGRRAWALFGGPLVNLVLAVLLLGGKSSIAIAGQWFHALAGLFRPGPSGTELSGLVGITEAVGEAAAYGWMGVVLFTGLLSLNVGLINLLPVPGLDGGKLLGLLIEKLNGGRRPRWEPVVQAIGIVAMLGLSIWVTGLEIARRIGWM